jgi:hypothetical protein
VRPEALAQANLSPVRPRRVTARREHGDVGAAESVDRLEVVADGEKVVVDDQVEDVALQTVRVLKLVDEHVVESLARSLAKPGPAAKQVARMELEVVEVERRALRLELRVAPAVEAEELVEEPEVADRTLAPAQLEAGTVSLLKLVEDRSAQGAGIASADRQASELERIKGGVRVQAL